MSLLSEIFKRISLIHPLIEVFLRKLYWRNVKILKRLNPHKLRHKEKKTFSKVDFDEIIEWYRKKGVGEGDILIVHSSLEGLEATGLTPDEIIDKLLDLIGPSGTLAMPVIRAYKGEPIAENLLKENVDNLICTYDVRKTPIISGYIPFRLLRRKNAKVSLHPLNPLCALGPLAEEMMKHNLDGEYPSPHGPNSSWKYAYDHGCKVVSLGVNIAHYNTIVHINEEAFGDWIKSSDEWFRLRKFNVIDEQKNIREVIVRERKPKWGLLHYTEIRMNHDLEKLNIITSEKIGGEVEVSYVDVPKFISYLRSKRKTGYPYYL